MVVFPHPDAPTIAVQVPGSMRKLTFLNALVCSGPGHAKSSFSIRTGNGDATSPCPRALMTGFVRHVSIVQHLNRGHLGGSDLRNISHHAGGCSQREHNEVNDP